jgi:UDP-N-acetylmuramyl-tripeptide synthetase
LLLSNVLKDLKERKKLNFKKFNPDIKGVHFNSQKILKDFIFVAIKGENNDGHKYIDEAIKKGAIFFVIENKKIKKNLEKKKINFIFTENSKFFLSKIASNFYINQPKKISAVTGTNGKTSVTFITKEIWRNCNVKSASIGTLGLIADEYKKKLELTTENSVKIHKILSILHKKKINHVCCEASSHGLDQHRLDNIKLDVAAFTNISQDHFDYHKTFQNYFNSKMRLFLKILKKGGVAIINSDLPETKKILNLCKKNKIKTFTYGYNSTDLKLVTFYEENNIQRIMVNHKNKIFNYTIPIIGNFQIYNSLCAICLAYFSGISINKCLKAIKKIPQIPGRLESIKIPRKLKKKISIFIDYAHTPDALKKTLETLKRNSVKLSVVFGCGGNRDRKKRPLMGKIANDFADKVYITDDNPRDESPKKIRKDIISSCTKAIEIKNRYLAIKQAINNCEEGEKLLIAGKGHEDYQIIGKKIYKFSDKDTVLKVLKNI